MTDKRAEVVRLLCGICAVGELAISIVDNRDCDRACRAWLAGTILGGKRRGGDDVRPRTWVPRPIATAAVALDRPRCTLLEFDVSAAHLKQDAVCEIRGADHDTDGPLSNVAQQNFLS